jgi:hypothetical protein
VSYVESKLMFHSECEPVPFSNEVKKRVSSCLTVLELSRG